MNCEELAQRINKQLGKEIKTADDEEEWLSLNKELVDFMRQASTEEYIKFKKCRPVLEMFSMIVEGIKYERNPKKYLAELAQMEHIG